MLGTFKKPVKTNLGGLPVGVSGGGGGQRKKELEEAKPEV